MKKRIAAMTLCLILLITLMPLSSAAENADNADTAAEAAIPADADMENDKIGIGINLFYHCEHYYKYTNPSGSHAYHTTFSYHKYPNEPATLSHVAIRATNQSGSWLVTGDYGARLAGNVKDVVKPEFFSSPDTVTTINNDAVTTGIADPTGEKVKAILKLTEADYQAIVEEFINWAKASGFNTAGGYTDNYGNNATCKDPHWDTADPADYKAVPYVVKFQGDHVWFIDMVILPRAKYTLGYDRNLDPGYTLPTGTKFPETVTYDEGVFADIVGNPNVTPTMTKDGKTYYAEFMYWVDEYGNKFGDGYTTTIPMLEDKVLYAIWNYGHNPQYGSLRVNKKVTNLKSNVVSPEGKTFDVTVTLADPNGNALTEPFSYKIYDRSSTVQLSGNLTSGSTFQLQDGWYIIIDHLPKDTVCTVDEKAPEHYRALRMPKTDAIVAGNPTRILVENVYAEIPVNEAWYTVEHYYQDEKGVYPIAPDPLDIETVTLNTDNNPPIMTNARPRTQAEYVVDAVRHPDGIKQDVVQIDGSTVIKIYYARLRYPYQVRYLEQGTNRVLRTADIRDPQLYLATVTETAPDLTGYTLQSARQQSCVIGAETEDAEDDNDVFDTNDIRGNIITFEYTENQVDFQYRVVGPDNCGTVSRASETVKVLTGTPAGAAAAENPGCKFVGWYLDAGCTQPVPDAWVDGGHLTPQKDRAADTPYTAATYYAKFECIVGNLEISKTVSKAYEADVIPPEDVFKLTVTLTPGTEAFENGRTYPYTVRIGDTVTSGTIGSQTRGVVLTLKGGETALISGLPLGGYQVEEAAHADYTLQSAAGAEGVITVGSTAAAAFHNEYTRHRGNLTITKSNAADPEQVFVYKVENAAGEIITVTVVGNGSTTIYDLFAGDYTVTQCSDWSWRYADPAQAVTVEAGVTKTAAFSVVVQDNKWLDGNSPLIRNKM